MNASKVIAAAKVAAKFQLAYKLNFFLLVIGPALAFFFVKYHLWATFFQDRDRILGYDFSKMIDYQIWVMLVGFLAQSYNSKNLAEDIRLGRISAYLVYPFNFWSFHTSQFLGIQGIQILIAGFTLVLFIVSGFMSDWNGFLLIQGFCLSLLVSFLWYQISYIIGIIAFWLDETWVLRAMFITLTQFLSGALIPLEFFPAWLMRWIEISPFPYLTSIPVKTFMGRLENPFWIEVMVICFWYGVMTTIGLLIWRRGLRLYSAAGM